jgi:hypothetical protein
MTSFNVNNSKIISTRTVNIEPCDLVGYTCISCSNVKGEFEGADFDKPVILDNGMIFTFNEYNYSYSYRPDVAIFAKNLTYSGKAITLYKLWIEDELYDATRVR